MGPSVRRVVISLLCEEGSIDRPSQCHLRSENGNENIKISLLTKTLIALLVRGGRARRVLRGARHAARERAAARAHIRHLDLERVRAFVSFESSRVVSRSFSISSARVVACRPPRCLLFYFFCTFLSSPARP